MTSNSETSTTSQSVSSILEPIERAILSGRIATTEAKTVSENLTACLSILDAAPSPEPQSLRTVHHLSCVGGTVLTKCIASMANTLVLNELDYHSSLTSIAKGIPSFAPTDMVSLLRQGDANIDQALLSQLLVENLNTVISDQASIGRIVVLREHSHGHFLVGPEPQRAKGTLAVIAGKIPTHSLVTIRDPAESYLSMKKAGWHTHFLPSDFNEYVNRYHAFLDAHSDVPMVKYEDFVNDPRKTMDLICNYLKLAYYDGFLDVFGSFRFSGDSGRGGQTIQTFPPRQEADEYRQHTSYRDLAHRLGYDDSSRR